MIITRCRDVHLSCFGIHITSRPPHCVITQRGCLHNDILTPVISRSPLPRRIQHIVKMEIEPNFQFWSDSTEPSFSNDPKSTGNNHHLSGAYHYPVNRLSGVVLELESDSDCDEIGSQVPVDRRIRLMDEELHRLQSISNVDQDDVLVPAETYVEEVSKQQSTPVGHKQQLNLTHESVGHTQNDARPMSARSHLTSPRSNASVDASAEPQREDSSTQKLPNPSPGAGLSPQRSRELAECGVRCPICNRHFINTRSMNIHLNKSHSGKSE